MDVALNEVHTEARVKSAWKHLLEGSHMELFEEASALNSEGRLFDKLPTAPVKGDELVPPDEKLSFVDECEDEELLAEPEDEMCEPAWSEPLELMAVAEEGQASSSSSTPASEIDPATLVPPTRVGQMSRFLALRLAYGTASKKDLDKLRQCGASALTVRRRF